jgi:hypothetical protein
MTNEEQYEGLRMMNVRTKAFWAGVAALKKQIEEQYGWLPRLEENLRAKVDSERAAKAGRAQKADTLTKAIRQVVETAPEISEKDLLKELAQAPGICLLDQNDMETKNCSKACQIRFIDQRGLECEVKVSSLKDRLSRAKTFSRKPDFAKDVN